MILILLLLFTHFIISTIIIYVLFSIYSFEKINESETDIYSEDDDAE